jgi:hypothetical protein
MWARTLLAPLRMLLFFLLASVAKSICSDSFSASWLGMLAVAAGVLGIWRAPLGLGSSFGLLSSLIHLVLDACMNISVCFLIFQSGDSRAPTLVALVMVACYYNLVSVIVCVLLTYCGCMFRE